MIIDILTGFPEIISGAVNSSILRNALLSGVCDVWVHDLRHYTSDRHGKIDDSPYGGGPGMVLMVEPIYKCLKSIRRKKKAKVILLDPAGRQFNQKMAKKFSRLDQLIFICGRYEGIDARVDNLIDEKISVGPYVLSGGELPAAIIIEATARLLPGVLGKIESTEYETFSGEKSDVVEYPQYTRPENFKGMKVPEILLSGNHKEIEKWRQSKQK